MKILEGRTGTGFTVSGDSVMIDRYGDVYPTIDNKMHPNPGTEKDGYSEIERTVDWLYRNKQKSVYSYLDRWVMTRVARLLSEGYTDDEEIVTEVFYSDLYTPSEDSVNSVVRALNILEESDGLLESFLEEDELKYARKIASWLNERFLRVRAGGKLNPEGADAIYFRISSHGYDWHRVIVDFLCDVFKDTKDMPGRVWVGHDAETNPPETVLFDGTPEDLMTSADQKVFEFVRRNRKFPNTNELNINYDRAVRQLDDHHREGYKIYGVKRKWRFI